VSKVPTNDIFSDLERAIKSNGCFGINNSIRQAKHCLADFFYEEDDLVNYYYIKYREDEWIYSFDKSKSSWRTYLCNLVRWSLLDLLTTENRKQKVFESYDKPPSEEVDGYDGAWLMDKYGRNDNDPEHLYIAQETYDIYEKIYGDEITDLLFQGLSVKEIACVLGKDYTSFALTMRRRRKKVEDLG